MTIHSHTTGYPKLVQEFIGALRRVGAIPERFVFSSIQLNHHPVVRRHRDQNKDKSMIASFGHFTGGVLMAARVGADESTDDAWERLSSSTAREPTMSRSTRATVIVSSYS